MSESLAAPIAERHNDPIVKAFADDFLPLFYARRRQLRAKYCDADGNLLLPAMPEFLAVPPAMRRKGEKKGIVEKRPDLNYRRADGCRKLCRIWSVVMSCTDHRTKELREPNPAAHNGHRFLSIARLAQLAQVELWEAERGMFYLRAARQITFTKQFREELADGSHRSSEAALRRVSYSSVQKAPCMSKVIEWRTRKLDARAKKTARRAAALGLGAEIIREQAKRPAAPAAPPSPVTRTAPPEIVDQVAAEHPDWPFGEILAEARRRADPT